MMKQKKNPIEVAKKALKERYPTATIVFVGGSFNRNEATSFSDIDLVVIFDKLENGAWRESFTMDGWPIEAFVHDPDTLHYFFREMDARDGVPALPNMVLEGTAIPECHELSYQLKSLADEILSEKPPVWTEETIYHERYGITDLIDDLREPRNNFEAHIVIAALHEKLGNFYFRSRGLWSASRKHIPRRLLKIDPSLGQEWIQVFEGAYKGDYQNLITFTEKILQPFGGLLFNGYKRTAPAEWRLPIQRKSNDVGLSINEVPLLPEEKIFNHTTLGKLQFRTVQMADVPQLRKLLNSSYKRLLDMGLNYNATFQDDELTERGLMDPNGMVLVVERDSELIATMKLSNFNQVDSRKCLYVGRFAVRPDLQKSGLGTLLLQLAEKIAIRNGYVCMQLDTAQPATHLISYYQSQGFNIISSIYYEGKTYVSWVLEKRL